MELREVLDDYVVTAVPERRTALSVVWSEPADGAGAVDDTPDSPITLAVLDDYRITRVPQAS